MWRKEAVSKAQKKYDKTEQGKNKKTDYKKTDDANEIRNKYREI